MLVCNVSVPKMMVCNVSVPQIVVCNASVPKMVVCNVLIDACVEGKCYNAYSECSIVIKCDICSRKCSIETTF